MSLQVNNMSACREEQVSKTKTDLNRGNSRKGDPVSPCHPEAQPVMTAHFPKKFTARKTLYFVGSGATPTFADAVAILSQDQQLSTARRRDLISALHRVAAACDLPPEQVPADPNWLRQKLATGSPLQLGRTAKTRANVLSNAAAALSSVGRAKRRPNVHRSREWQTLWGKLSVSAKIIFGSFTKFCTYHQIRPDQVTNEVVARYREAVVQSSLRKKPDELIHDLTVHWNRCVDAVPGWPKQRLSVLNRRVQIGFPIEALPRTFRDDMEAYLSRGHSTDLLDDDAPPPLAAATIRHRRTQILRFFGELVADGVSPAELVELRAMVDPGMALRGLQAMLRRKGGSSGMIHNTAYMLLVIAKHHAHHPDDDLQKLRGYCAKLKVDRQGMTEKNRKRLRQFSDPKNLSQILLLPETLLLEAQTRPLSLDRAATLVEVALAIELFLMTALRIKNIAALHLDDNFQWTRSSRRGVCHLVVDGRQVKNGADRDYELEAETVALLKTFMQRYRPYLAPTASRWLFAQREGDGPVNPVVLGRRISRTIRNRTGLVVNPHLFRSLGAKIYLDKNPGGYEVARQLLGHKHLSTTTAAYTGMESVSAAKQFDRTIRECRERAKAMKTPQGQR